MVYLGIAFVVLLIVAPIIALLPSARQKEQMALRRAARAQGLRTELTTIEDPDPDPERYVSATGKALERKLKCIAYRRPRPRAADWRRLPTPAWAVIRNGQPASELPAGWQWSEPMPETASGDLRSGVIDALSRLPDDAMRVDEAHYTISVYWRENGGMKAFEQINEVLRTLADIDAHVRPDDGETESS